MIIDVALLLALLFAMFWIYRKTTKDVDKRGTKMSERAAKRLEEFWTPDDTPKPSQDITERLRPYTAQPPTPTRNEVAHQKFAEEWENPPTLTKAEADAIKRQLMQNKKKRED